MTDAVLCDRCGEATALTEYQNGLRSALDVEYLTPPAVAHRDREWELCESCTVELLEWADLPFPAGFDPVEAGYRDEDPGGDAS